MKKQRPRIGIYDPYLFEMGGGERYICIYAETLQHNYYVEIISHDSTSLGELEKRFNLDLANVTKRELPPKRSKMHHEDNRGWLRSFLSDRAADKTDAFFTADYDLFINLSNGIPNYSLAEKSILLLQMPYSDTELCQADKVKSWKERLRCTIFGSSLTTEEVLKLRSYDRKAANSEFTRKWIRRLWNVESDVIYTGSDTSQFTPSPKENIILSVGRFQSDLFCKNQHILVDTFKNMCENGLDDWQLHLVGGISEKAEEHEYFQRVAESSAYYPIKLHPNAALEKLKDLYARARIFWHATGLTENEERTPWRMEHFGLTTVEAMSAGCIPVVIGKGGQPEIVTHGKDGYLWSTIEELKTQTMHLIESNADEETLRRLAIDRSRDFEKSIFQRNIKALAATLLPAYEEAFA